MPFHLQEKIFVVVIGKRTWARVQFSGRLQTAHLFESDLEFALGLRLVSSWVRVRVRLGVRVGLLSGFGLGLRKLNPRLPN